MFSDIRILSFAAGSWRSSSHRSAAGDSSTKRKRSTSTSTSSHNKLDNNNNNNSNNHKTMPSRLHSSSSILSSSSSSSSSPHKTKKHKQKTVQFAEYATLHQYRRPHSVDGTSTWYSLHELRAFRVDAIATICRIVGEDLSIVTMTTEGCGGALAAAFLVDDSTNVGNSDGYPEANETEQEEYCPRGCENRTPMGNAVRRRHRTASMNAVFQYQDQCRRHLRLKRKSLATKTMAAATTTTATTKTTTRTKNSSSSSSKETNCTTPESLSSPSSLCNSNNNNMIRLAEVMDADVVGELYASQTGPSKQAAQLVGKMDQWDVRQMILQQQQQENKQSLRTHHHHHTPTHLHIHPYQLCKRNSSNNNNNHNKRTPITM